MSTSDSLNSKREEANRIVSEILEKSKILEQRLEQSNQIIAKQVGNSRNSDNLNASLKATITATNKTLDRFREQRKKIYTLLNTVNSFYEKKYLPTLAKIDHKENGFQAKLNLSKKASDEISKLKATASQQIEDVKTISLDLKKKYPELKRIDVTIRKLAENTQINNDKSKSSKEAIVVLEASIKKLNIDLQNLFNASSKDSKRINELLQSSNEDINNITSNSEKSNNVLAEIQKIYDLAAQTGLSGEFERQKNQLFQQLRKWEKRIFLTSSFLLIAIIGLFSLELILYKWELKSIDVNFYLRFVLFSPVIYYLYFCTNQFGNAKKLYDKYTFKTTLAMSIQNHIKILLDEEKFDVLSREKILQFVLDGFQKIYSEPYTENNMKMALKLQNIEMNLEKKIHDKLNDIKEELQ